MERLLKYSLILFLLTFILCVTPCVNAQITTGAGSNVSAVIGNYKFKLYGYSSPQAYITINGMGVSEATYANTTGYFEVSSGYSPLAPREICLSSQDQFGRLSTPVCLPPFPVKYDITIGPVIMPPTLSLDKTDYFIGDEVILTGQSIPGKDITISVFTENKENGLIKGVEAFTFPKIKSKTDQKGNFSIALPSAAAKKYRLFSQVDYNEQVSPKSLALSIDILPIWMIIIRILQILWQVIKNHILDILLIGQIIALILYLINYYFHPLNIFRTHALMLRRKDYSLTIQEHSLTLIK